MPYFPFSAQVCLNQHHWLARQMLPEGVDFETDQQRVVRFVGPARPLSARLIGQDAGSSERKGYPAPAKILPSAEGQHTVARIVPR
jgi:hypothetical protein